MAQEFKIGRLRFTWRGRWTSTVFYNRDAIVQYNGKSYVCLTPHTASNNFYNDLYFVTGEGGSEPRWDLVVDGRIWKNEWEPSTFYSLGNIVKYSGVVYICTEEHTSGSSQIDLSKWETYSSFDNWTNQWTPATVYGIGDIVKYGGIVYRCIANHLSSVSSSLGLEAAQANWEIVNEGVEYKGDWTSAVRYKKNDLVKVNAAIYRCEVHHTSTTTFEQSNWVEWVPGVEYTDTWNETTVYQPGDVVKYGGYSYICKLNNVTGVIPSTNAVEWDLLTVGYRLRDEWSGGAEYEIGDVVRRGGTLFVATADNQGQDPASTEISVEYVELDSVGTTVKLTSTADVRVGMTLVGNGFLAGQTIAEVVDDETIIVSEPPNIAPVDGELILFVGLNYTYWSMVVPGYQWKSFWEPNTFYVIGEIVFWKNLTSVCVRSHSSSNIVRPDLDTDNDYWVTLIKHDPANAGSLPGDIVFYQGDASTSLPIIDSTTQAVGDTEQFILKVDGTSPAWRELNIVPRVFYVNTDGEDREDYGKTWDQPWKTIKYACEQSAKGDFNLQADFILRANKEFLVREMYEWMLYNKENSVPPFNPSSEFDEFSTLRDAKLIIDALSYDITRGSNSKTVFAALAFFAEGSDTSFRNAATDAAQEYIVSALTQLRNIITQALGQTPLTMSYQEINRAWQPTQTYSVDDVIYNDGFWYKSLINSNTNRNPSTSEDWEITTTPTDVIEQTINNSYTAEPSAAIEIGNLMEFLITAIQNANTKFIPLPNYGITTTIQIKTGTYFEDLPIVVPDNTALNGDELRGVVVRPKNSVVTTTRVSSGATSSFKLATVENISVNDPIQFNADTVNDDFGSVTLGRTYYVKGVNPLTREVTISETPGGDVLSIPSDSGFMTVAAGNCLKDMFYVRNATGIRNMTCAGLHGFLSAPNNFGTRRPTGGAYVSLDPGTGPEDTRGWIMKRSPYIQNVTNFGTGCTGLKIDGTLHNGGNKSITCNDFTQIISDGIGVWCTGTGSLTECVSVFSYYCYTGYFAEDGGRIRATNGNSSYGTYGVIAEGFDPLEVPISAVIDNRSSQVQAIVQNAFGVSAEVLSMQYANAGSNYFEQTTNLVKNSNEFLSSPWQTDGNLLFQKNLVSPTGEANAWTITAETSNSDSSYMYQDIAVSAPGQSFVGLGSTNITGSGIGALFDVVVKATEYEVTVNQGGSGFVVGNQLRILGSTLGGVDGINDCIITVSTLTGSSIQTASATGQVPTNSDLKYTLSVHVKRGTAQLVDLYGIFSGSQTLLSGVSYNFDTEIITTIGENGALNPTEYGALELPNGWYRLWFTLYDTSAANSSLQFRIYPRGRLGFSGSTRLFGSQVQIGDGLTFYANTKLNTLTTNADFVITGAGVGAEAVGDELRGGAVFEARVVDEGIGPGGRGYSLNTNNGQAGDEYEFAIAQSDVNEESDYVGMRLFIQSGTGAGQYGYIASYNPFNKVAKMVKESFTPLSISATSASTDRFTLSGSTTDTLYEDQLVRFIPTYYTTIITDTSKAELQILETVGGQSNWLVVPTTAQLQVNMQIRFTGTTYGGVVTGFTYYVREILDNNRFTISTEQFGPIWLLTTAQGTDLQNMKMIFPGFTNRLFGSTENMLPNMPIQFTGLSLGGTTIGATYYVSDIINSNEFTMSSNLIQLDITATAGDTNRLVCDSTSTLVPLNPIIFSGDVFGGVTAGTKYYISNIINSTTFTITESVIETTATATTAISNLITVASTAGFIPNAPIKFVGRGFGGLVTGNIYYVLAVNDATSVTVSETPGGSAVNLATDTGLMAVSTANGLVDLTTASGTMISTTTSAITTLAFSVGSMTATFATNLFGGVSSATDYYVKSIDSDTEFTVSTTPGGIETALITNSGTMNVVAAGWDHINPGTEIVSAFDSSTVYYIEPRITFSKPGFAQQATTTNVIASETSWADISYGNGLFIAVPNGQQIISKTTDGETWTPITIPVNRQWSGVAYGNNYWAIISRGGNQTESTSTALVSKANGDGWKVTTLPTKSSWIRTVYGNGKFVAIAAFTPEDNTDPENIIPAVNAASAYSIDFGNTWVSGTGLTTSAVWTGLCYGFGKYVAVASGGTTAAVSDNGINWTSTTLPSSTTWSSVAYGNGLFVAVSNTSAKPAFSTDGITWRQSAYNVEADLISYGQGVFVALSSSTGVAYVSEDGFNWTQYSVSDDGYSAVAFGWVGENLDGGFITLAGQTTASIIKAGAQTKGRVNVAANRITAVTLFEPGSNYTAPPAITIRDPNITVEAAIQPRIGNGTLGNPTFLNRGQGYSTTSTTVSIRGGGFADRFQTGLTLTVKNLTRLPGPGDNLVIEGNDRIYKITSATPVFGTVAPNILANLTVGQEIRNRESPDHETPLLIRTKYSQARLTGHDYLSIGYGNFEQTNYPSVPEDTVLAPQDQAVEVNFGRVFYTSTDQDGNFKVGDLFGVEQATGIVTLSASQFGLSGLETLSLGGIAVGQASVVVRQFSTETTFIANSNELIPTQRAIKAYLTGRLSQGGSNTFTGQLIAGTVLVGGPDKIRSTVPNGIPGSVVNMPNKVMVEGQFAGWDGNGMAYQFFVKQWVRPGAL